jgi:D-sedoheptulose 7-phosphate isomerase
MGSPGESIDSHEKWRSRICDHLIQSAELKYRTAESASESVLAAISRIVGCYRSAGKVLICGNGGSAADAQHMAAEFMNRLRADFQRPGLPAIALNTDTSFLTSYANDVGYDGVFERQVLALGNSADVLIGISTSGNSVNVLRAVEAANDKGLKTIGLLGEGGRLTEIVSQAVVVPSRDTQHVQETLLTVEHIICAAVEEILFPPP